jgi:hypothetical protein
LTARGRAGAPGLRTDILGQKSEDAGAVRPIGVGGQDYNREQFRNLGEKGGRLFEFKRFQDRFLGDFRPGRRFLVAAYEQKKKDHLDPAVIDRAMRVLAENDRYEAKPAR